MTFVDWLHQTRALIRDEGLAGVRESAFLLWKGAFRRLDLVRDGVGIYERDWDLLLIVDGCRHDLMAEVVDEYPWLTCRDPVWSVGSCSPEWMRKNFNEDTADLMNETGYVTANPHSARDVAPVDEFSVLDEVWKYRWDDGIETVPAEDVTDRAIAVHREESPERLIVHYMQPHHPFVPDPFEEADGIDIHRTKTPIWDLLKEGAVEREEVWERYRDNLRYVLDSIELLVENVDAERVVVTSDHGNLLGEYGFYGHPGYVAVEPLRLVPWCVATAEDTGEYQPETPAQEDVSTPVQERLESLGYT